MFKSGIVKNADDEDDEDAAAQKRAEGRTGVQINLSAWNRALDGKSAEWKSDDELMSIGWLEPMNAFMAIASMIAEQDEGDRTLGNLAKTYLAGSVQSVLDMPVMGNIANAVDTFRYSAADNVGEKAADTALSLAGDALSGMIPAPFGQAARTIDPYYRDVSADSSIERVWNSIKNSIPGLRETLPVKTDNFGQPKEYTNDALMRALNNFAFPGTVNQFRQSDVSSEIERLYEATGDAGVYPDRNAPTSVTADGTKYRLTSDERRSYHEIYGNTIQENVEKLLKDQRYAGMSDSERAAVIGDIKQYASYKAKQAYMKSKGKSYSDARWVKVESITKTGISLIDALTWKTDADTSGNGSLTQDELYAYLQDSGYTPKQKASIWETMGWSKDFATYSASK